MLRHEIGPRPDAPLYAEVRRRIVGSLRQSERAHGGRIPGYPQLAKRYGVGVGTLRKAVDALMTDRISPFA
jgi:GntR family transcriptional regulator